MALSGPPLDTPVDLSRLLERGRDADPGAVALVSREACWTWREVDEASLRLASGLLALGLAPGDRVASLMPNRAALLVHYLACMRAGLVSVPLNYRYMAPEIDHALEVSGASALFAHAERDPDIATCRCTPGLAHGLVRYGDGVGERSFEALISGPAEDAALPPHDPSAPAFMFFTSGSTGPAKGVTHSGESIGWMMASAAAAFEYTPDDVVLPGSSMSHLGGFLFSLAALSTGASVVIARSFDPDEILPLLREDRPTVLCMLPAALFGLVRDGHATREDFASLRLCRGGSDKVPAELEREFTALTGLVIDEGYGCSEIGLACLNPPDGVIKIGSVGPPVPGFTLSIRSEDGGEVPAGQDGRLWARARSLMLGYWGREDASAEVMRDGWFDTGDVMAADDDGYLQFRGRKKQIIVHDGSNICPQEVEEALLDHPAVASAGVVGVHDLLHGESVRAYVTLRDGAARPTGHELIRFARARIGYKAPEEVLYLEEMPLNPTGKVDRVALKRMAAEAHQPTASARAPVTHDPRERPIPWRSDPPTALDYRDVPVDPNNPLFHEPLVDLAEAGIAGRNHYARGDGLNAPYYHSFGSASDGVWNRRSVAERLVAVNTRLAELGVELFVFNGYRTLGEQWELWAFFMDRARTVLDDRSEEACVAFAGIYSSDPRAFDAADPRTWPTHLTGGAVDTTLRSLETREFLYMGSIFDDPSEVSDTAHFERELTRRLGDDHRLTLSEREALRNRRLLYWAMTDAGFANYPREWWHFDWGTQFWIINSRSQETAGSEPSHAWYGPAPIVDQD